MPQDDAVYHDDGEDYADLHPVQVLKSYLWVDFGPHTYSIFRETTSTYTHVYTVRCLLLYNAFQPYFVPVPKNVTHLYELKLF